MGDGGSIRGATALALASLAFALAALLGRHSLSPIALVLALGGGVLLVRSLVPGMAASDPPWSADPAVLRWGRRVLLTNGAFALVVVTTTVARGTGSWELVGLLDVLLCLAVVLGWDLLRDTPRLFAGRSTGLFVAAIGVLGLLWILIVPTGIDVHMFQEVGSSRLLDGVNPYAPGYPDVYPPALSRQYYAPGLSVDGVLQVGFPYPPASLLSVLPGHVLGDVRLALLGAILLTAHLMMRLAPTSPVGRLGGILLLTSPVSLFVVRHAWTEPLLLLGMTGLVLAMVRGTRWRGPLLGLTLVMKQFAVIFLPVIAVLGTPEGVKGWRPRTVLAAVATAAVLTAPFLLWGPRSFLDSVVGLHLRQPFRSDSLSLLAAGQQWVGWPPPSAHLWLTVVAVVGAWAIVVRLAPREPWAVAAGSALVLFGFVIMSKQAFSNYYFLMVGLALLGVSSWAARGAKDVPSPPQAGDREAAPVAGR